MEFLEGRKAHLLNKEQAVIASFARVLPAEHRKYKEQVLLPMIREALRQIRDGSYGICLDCGEPIPQRRLELRPESIRCVPCQSVREEG